ncbi:hypothetical protein BH11ACT8_BH11ACT8_15090 [soil metagenome]
MSHFMQALLGSEQAEEQARRRVVASETTLLGLAQDADPLSSS